jgi:glycosyltransferase involved in cell wall biosynthesis
VTRLPRVLFSVGGHHRGGSESQLFELISHTHGRRLDAALITFTKPSVPERDRRLEELGVERVRIGIRGPTMVRMVAALPLIAAHVRRLRPDVIYPWLEAPATVLGLAAHAFHVPLVIGRRNIIGSKGERFAPISYGIRRVERSAALVTGNSQAVLETAAARGVDRERLRLVRNGHVPADPLPPPPAPPVVVGCVANFRPEKGHGRLLAALKDIRASTPWRVDLAGTGSLAEGVAAEIRRLGLEERARVVGIVTDPREFWRDRHLAVLASASEGSPNALIEAAMCGRPLVGTAVGGTVEVIQPTSGLTVERDDTPGLAEALGRLIDDAGLRERLGEGAFEHASREFAMERSIDSHLAVIEEAMGR